jgi:hypothetical protein
VVGGGEAVSRFEFSLAGAADDAQLRQRMAQDWMEGGIAVSFRREPSYFAGCALQGEAAQIIKCTARATGRIVGMGSRLKTRVYVNGAPAQVGYLADLRAAPQVRNRTLLARGYRFLRGLEQADRLPFSYTVVYDGNERALQALLGARAGLPVYAPLGTMLTPALHLDVPKRALRLPGVSFTRGSSALAEAIVSFLNARMALRQLAPVYRLEEFRPGGRLAAFPWQTFFVALRDGRVVGTLAAWDQSAVRQTHVERYPALLALLRPLYNLASRLTPLKPLPSAGSRVPYLYFSGLSVEQDDPQLFRALLRFAYNALRGGPWHYAIAGLHERDPLAPLLGEYRSIAAAGRIFVVTFDDAPAALDGRIPYVEMAFV